jgi:hypothetical protein
MLLDWVREGDYDRMARGDYMRIGEEPTAGEEAGEAGAFYGERIGNAFAQAGSSIADVGQQLGDWLKRTRDARGGDDDGGTDARGGDGGSDPKASNFGATD